VHQTLITNAQRTSITIITTNVAVNTRQLHNVMDG